MDAKVASRWIEELQSGCWEKCCTWMHFQDGGTHKYSVLGVLVEGVLGLQAPVVNRETCLEALMDGMRFVVPSPEAIQLAGMKNPWSIVKCGPYGDMPVLEALSDLGDAVEFSAFANYLACFWQEI